MSDELYEIMVIVQNPADFLSWPEPKKLRFYQHAVSWHEYISRLREQGHVTHAWGTQKMPGRVEPLPTKMTLIAIYKVTFDKFSELLPQDPLWNYAFYMSPILKSIEGDYDNDVRLFERKKAFLEDKLGKKLGKSIVTFQGERPEIAPGGKLEILVKSNNSPGYPDLSDEEQLAIHEKVLQMHDYHRPFRESGVIAYEWGTYQNCGMDAKSKANTQAGVWISRVNSYDQFDELFLTNPIRDSSYVFTAILVPFEESERRAMKELRSAGAQLK